MHSLVLPTTRVSSISLHPTLPIISYINSDHEWGLATINLVNHGTTIQTPSTRRSLRSSSISTTKVKTFIQDTDRRSSLSGVFFSACFGVYVIDSANQVWEYIEDSDSDNKTYILEPVTVLKDISVKRGMGNYVQSTENKIYNVKTGKSLPRHSHCKVVEFGACGDDVACVLDDGRVLMWDGRVTIREIPAGRRHVSKIAIGEGFGIVL